MVNLLSLLQAANQQHQQLEHINTELKHRLKNLFSITHSICVQTIRSGRTPDEMASSIGGRIMALAQAQDLLSETAQKGARLDRLIEALVAPMAPDTSRLVVAGPDVHLRA